MQQLLSKIDKVKAHVAIVGIGYVGLPLAVIFAKRGFRVTGVDADRERVRMVERGKSYVADVSDTELAPLVEKGLLRATADYSSLKEADAISICVPTPLRKTRDPDISYILDAAAQVRVYLRKGQLIVLESTTYPGTTEEVVLPILSETGLKVGKEFFLAFSPERVDPGNPKFNTQNTPKILAGITPNCTRVAMTLYEKVIDQVVPVGSTRAAEMVKLLENTFRAVNIALVNEVALMCDKLGVDTWEVIDAAATKPFGFMPFYPGPGLGGHCIPVDPHYLSWKLRGLNYTARFIELAGEVNSYMPLYVVTKVADALNSFKKSINGSRILILGVAYKRNVSDCRESPALDIIRLLKARGARVAYHDPYVPELETDDLKLKSVSLTPQALATSDCVVIVTDHSQFAWGRVVQHSNLIVDTRNATKGTRSPKVIKL